MIRATSDTATSATTVLGTVTALAFSVTSGVTYCFAFNVLFRSATTTNGLKLGLQFPAATIAGANIMIPSGADGTAQVGWITSSGDSVTATGVETADTTYLALIDGNIRPSANGTLQVVFASEVSDAASVVKQESAGMIVTIP
jgi:hypothetical protein